MMTTDCVGLYLHIPYCVRKCAYCDFCSVGGSASVPDDYVTRILEEADCYRSRGIAVDTVFLGGGTPSLLSSSQLCRLTDGLRRVFGLADDLEFTIECNPGTTTLDFFREAFSCGVNRISFGLQSIHENELKMLGRIHSYGDFLASYSDARAVGFDNISVDLMYGIPGQTFDSFKKTLEAVVGLAVEHISAYGLIIEDGTPFYKVRDSLALPDEDTECDMYFLADEYLSSHGFSHYEISNFARKGFECRHNLKYWRRQDYIGLGASAHSCLGNERFYNTSSVNDYLLCKARSTVISEESDEPCEYVMLNLRLQTGIDLLEYRKRFDEDFLCERRSTVLKYIDAGLMKQEGGRLFLTPQGFYLSNSIISELI